VPLFLRHTRANSGSADSPEASEDPIRHKPPPSMRRASPGCTVTPRYITLTKVPQTQVIALYKVEP